MHRGHEHAAQALPVARWAQEMPLAGDLSELGGAPVAFVAEVVSWANTQVAGALAVESACAC